MRLSVNSTLQAARADERSACWVTAEQHEQAHPAAADARQLPNMNMGVSEAQTRAMERSEG
jgi:hypothetical protein